MKLKYGTVTDMATGQEIKVITTEFYESVIHKQYTGETISAYSQAEQRYLNLIEVSKLSFTVRARIEFAIVKDRLRK